MTFLNLKNFHSVIPYGKEDNKYIFYLMYFDSESDKNFKCIKGTYDSSNIVLTEPKVLTLPNTESTYFNIDCVLLENENEKIISCFYGTNNLFILNSFNPEKDFQLINAKSIQFPVAEVTKRYVFKSMVLPGNQRAIFCSYSKNDIFDCAWYDVLTNEFYNYTKTDIEGSDFYAYNIYIDYFEETHEVLIGKQISPKKISTMKCSKELECSDPTEQSFSDINTYITRVNIIFLSNKYYAIATDEVANPTKYQFELNIEPGLTCKNYYNLDKTSCLSYVPDGYYCNDETAKTIVQCNSKCSKCNKESQDDNKCISCNNDNEYYPK